MWKLTKNYLTNVSCNIVCKWNWLISKLIIDIKDCPVAQCVCKKNTVDMPTPTNMQGPK